MNDEICTKTPCAGKLRAPTTTGNVSPGFLLVGSQLAPSCPLPAPLSDQEAHLLSLETFAPSPPRAPLRIKAACQGSEERLWTVLAPLPSGLCAPLKTISDCVLEA